MSRNAEPEDTPKARLQLLCRTLRSDQGGLALKVQYLKLPYMTRETSKPDLARTVAATPNLRYVDLPEQLFMDDPSCHTLKLEIQARCPDLRKMCYMKGAERSLEMLANGYLWTNLEVLELSRLNMDPTILRNVLGALPNLQALKVTDMPALGDDLFRHSDYLPPWPPLAEMIFENTLNLTAEGLVAYLSRSDTQQSLKTLSLTGTSVHPSTVQQILAVAPALQHLSIIESVSTSFPASSGLQLLNSQSLRILHYEITSAASENPYASTTESYYAYLRSSLLSSGLPRLKELYVRGTYPSPSHKTTTNKLSRSKLRRLPNRPRTPTTTLRSLAHFLAGPKPLPQPQPTIKQQQPLPLTLLLIPRFPNITPAPPFLPSSLLQRPRRNGMELLTRAATHSPRPPRLRHHPAPRLILRTRESARMEG